MGSMQKTAVLGCLGLLLAGPAQAADELLNKYGCSSCHQDERKLVGPAFQDVATKYRTDKTAVAKLIAKVKSGGSGVWGVMVMPPHPAVPDEDLQKMVQVILASRAK